ncbi:MAG: hypothetical protein R3E68_12195 [Burkholderiaceae bacterium]
MMFMLVLAKRFAEADGFTRKADWLNARKLTQQTFELKGKRRWASSVSATRARRAGRARPSR